MKVLCILLCVAFTTGFYIDNNGIHEDKIIGGDLVRIEDVPYQATLVWLGFEYFCGATIIHESWAITAAYCVKNRRHISIKTGSGLRNTLGKKHTGRALIHEDYETNSKNNNIALIELAEPIEFNDKQQRIEIAKPNDMPTEGQIMRISGFGETGLHLGGSDDLKAAHVYVVNQEQCQRIYRSDHHITDGMFCAGNGYPAFNNNDAGGPGVINGKLYGIISSVSSRQPRIFPGVYTRVHKYYEWIVAKTRIRF